MGVFARTGPVFRNVLASWRLFGMAAALAGCATSSGSRSESDATAVATAAAGPVGAFHNPPRAVQAIEVDGASIAGQTSWQITPAVSLLPECGNHLQPLPPQISNRLKYAYDLAQRGATYSAYGEFQGVLASCAAELDTREGGSRHRDAVQEGLTALKEVEDFTASRGVTTVGVDVPAIAMAHRTPLGKQAVADSWSVDVATRAYYQFAMRRIGDACSGAPGAANAIYGMGRTSALLDARASHKTLRALLLYDLALQIDPAHSLAANELAVLLAQNGRYIEAESVLQAAVKTGDRPECWKNLSVVCQQLGKMEESRTAHARYEALTADNKASPETPRFAVARTNPPSDARVSATGNPPQTDKQNSGGTSGNGSGQSIAGSGNQRNLFDIFRR
ncbi:MAG: CDC27 family protein [Planctomycetota bacterium]